MPLIFDKSPETDCRLMVWKIEENALFFKNKLGERNFKTPDFEQISHPHKQLEWLASRFLAKYLAEAQGLSFSGLIKDAYNKPYLLDSNYHLSLSHTTTHVAAGIHMHKPLGIDLETVTQRLHIIKHKFLTDTERKDADDNIEKLCIYWSAKESLYKLYGKRGVHFQNELQVQPFQMDDAIIHGAIKMAEFQGDFQIQAFKIENDYLTVAY